MLEGETNEFSEEEINKPKRGSGYENEDDHNAGKPDCLLLGGPLDMPQLFDAVSEVEYDAGHKPRDTEE